MTPATGPPAEAGATDDRSRSGPTIVDWARTARRLATSLSVIGVAIVVTWVAVALVGDGPRPRLLAELVGLGLLAAFVVEVVVVGGAAVRGLLRAGERGERLAGQDVSLLPPQARRRSRGRP